MDGWLPHFPVHPVCDNQKPPWTNEIQNSQKQHLNQHLGKEVRKVISNPGGGGYTVEVNLYINESV